MIVSGLYARKSKTVCRIGKRNIETRARALKTARHMHDETLRFVYDAKIERNFAHERHAERAYHHMETVASGHVPTT